MIEFNQINSPLHTRPPFSPFPLQNRCFQSWLIAIFSPHSLPIRASEQPSFPCWLTLSSITPYIPDSHRFYLSNQVNQLPAHKKTSKSTFFAPRISPLLHKLSLAHHVRLQTAKLLCHFPPNMMPNICDPRRT